MAQLVTVDIETVPQTQEEILAYLQKVMPMVAEALRLFDDSLFNKTNAAPGKTEEGMIRYADGVNWNPNSQGQGYYHFDGTNWIKLQDQDEKDAASGYPGTDAGNGIILTGTPPAAPVANRLYKHPNAGGHLAVPITAADADAAIAGALTAAQGGIAAGSLEGWHVIGAASEPAFVNSWVSSGFSNPAFRKMPDGTVRLMGSMKNGTLAATAFTLPVGYRPMNISRHVIWDAAGTDTDRIFIGTDGAVAVQNATVNTEANLDGITFLAGG